MFGVFVQGVDDFQTGFVFGAALQGVELCEQLIYGACAAFAFEQAGCAVFLPAFGFFFAQGWRKVAGAVAPNQFWQALIVKAGVSGRQLRQLCGLQGEDVFEFAAVVVVNKAVVQGCIYVGRRGGVGGLRGEDFALDGAHVGQGAGGVGVLQGLLQVELAGAGLLGA